jgi:hypothetical protein
VFDIFTQIQYSAIEKKQMVIKPVHEDSRVKNYYVNAGVNIQ